MNKRISKLRASFEKRKIDAVLISNYYNILYLTGFQGLSREEREAFVLVTDNSVFLFIDSRYYFEKDGIEVRMVTREKGLIAHLSEIIKGKRMSRIGFETEDLKFHEYTAFTKGLNTVEFIPQEKYVRELREYKDEDEMRYIKGACEIGDKSLKELMSFMKSGITEKELAWRLEMIIRSSGYELGFDPIVAVDGHAALPHYNTKTGEGKVKDDSVILIDFGVKSENYISDITRMFFMKSVSQEVKNIYNKLEIIQQKTVQMILKVKTLNELDLFCRTEYKKNRLPQFTHALGHGVGLEIHESPLVHGSLDVLKKTGHVFTIEPGVYVEGSFGMRLEDTVAIHQNGYELLTKFPRSIIVI